MAQKNSSSIFLLLILLLLIILPTSFSLVDQDKELGYNCLPSTRAPNDGNFITNRKNLIAEIYNKAIKPRNKGFYYTNKGSLAQDPDAAYGLGRCRGDITTYECGFCLSFFDNFTTASFDKRCNSRGAIIWRNHCMIKYSDLDFRGQRDDIHMIFNMTSKGHGGLGLEVAIGNLMSDLRKKISESKNSFYFATATQLWTKKKKPTITMYGMAQCNGDLSMNDCVKCIDVAINYLLLRFIRRVGAIASYGSCTLRYDNAPFF